MIFAEVLKQVWLRLWQKSSNVGWPNHQNIITLTTDYAIRIVFFFRYIYIYFLYIPISVLFFYIFLWMKLAWNEPPTKISQVTFISGLGEWALLGFLKSTFCFDNFYNPLKFLNKNSFYGIFIIQELFWVVGITYMYI